MGLDTPVLMYTETVAAVIVPPVFTGLVLCKTSVLRPEIAAGCEMGLIICVPPCMISVSEEGGRSES